MKKAWMRLGLLIFVFLLVCSDVWAGAVNPIGGVGTRAKGMGGPGTAIADDAAIFYYNPALLVASGSFAQIGTDFIYAKIKYEDPTGKVHKSDPGEYFIPLAGAAYQLPNKKIAFGVGMITPYIFGSDFKQELSMMSKLSLTGITPSVAYKINKNLSVGASLILGHGVIELSQPTSMGRLDSETDGWGYGYQLGALYQANEWLTLGATYQSKIRVELEGKTKAFTPMGNQRSDLTTVFYFPGRASIGAAAKIDKWLISADATWFDYSSTDVTNINYASWPDSKLRLGWKNSWKYALGAEYSATDKIKLRTGLGYQSKVVPDSTCNPITPDTNGISASVGLGIKVSEAIKIDLAYLHAWGKERKVPLSQAGAGKYSASIDILSLAVVYSW